MRGFLAYILVLLTIVAPNLGYAQQSVNAPLTPEERPLVRAAVSSVHDAYKRDRAADGIGGIVGGLITGGLGGYLWVVGRDSPDVEEAVTLQLVGIGIALSAVPQLISGVWNIFYLTPQEEIAAKLLNDDQLLDSAGLLFVEQEARRAKRQRLVGGTTTIAQGAALLGSYFLYAQIFGSIDILLLFFGIAAGLSTIGGIIELVGLSGSEKAYRDLLRALGRTETPPTPEENRVSRLRLQPTLFSNEGKVAVGAGFSLGF